MVRVREEQKMADKMMGKKNISLKMLCRPMSGGYKILGDSNRCVSTASPIEKASKKSVTFCSESTGASLQLIRSSRAGVIISPDKLDYREDDYQDKTLILVSNPRLAFAQVMQKHFQKKIKSGIHPTVVIDAKVIIGKNVTIQAGAVIGAEGFGHEQNGKGRWIEFPQVGGVIIKDDVEIGSNTSVMRGAMGNTIIGQGTKIGHLCSIGHGAIIGKHCFIVSHSVLGGSCRIGDYSQISLGACIRNGIKIGKNVVVGMGAVVTKNVDDGKIVFGVPAKEQGETSPGCVYMGRR